MTYPITSRFGQKESFRNYEHTGVDLSMPKGTDLRSIQDGIVEKVLHNHPSLGNSVFVKWEDGKTAIYAHMNDISVRLGEKVDVGTLLGHSGNTGNVFGQNGGYHLHFAIKEGGNYVDPSPYINHIQSMNNLDKLQLLTQTKQIVAEKTASTLDFMQSISNVYSDFFQSLKLNIIHSLTSIDYTMLIQCLKYLFQFLSW
mgnify:CR=1 FL=1